MDSSERWDSIQHFAKWISKTCTAKEDEAVAYATVLRRLGCDSIWDLSLLLDEDWPAEISSAHRQKIEDAVHSAAQGVQQTDNFDEALTIFSAASAFAAVMVDGSVVTWGDSGRGGDSSSVSELLSEIENVVSTRWAFAAVKHGTVVTWGDDAAGGDSSSVKARLVNVRHVYSTDKAFAALKEDGTVVSWGQRESGGDSAQVRDRLRDICSVYSTATAFAALRGDGSVVTWGFSDFGGNSDLVQLRDIRRIASTSSAFAALTNAGEVVTWGHPQHGGVSSNVKAFLARDVDAVFSTHGAFAALKSGSVVTWGDSSRGGDSKSVSSRLNTVKHIYANGFAFVAVTDAGVIAWGDENCGGRFEGKYDIVDVFHTERAFAALEHEGFVVTWGHPKFGGDCDRVRPLLIEVRTIRATLSAFAALKDDNVVTWGDPDSGGDSHCVTDELHGVTEIFATDKAFVAMASGRLITWGHPEHGGTCVRARSPVCVRKMVPAVTGICIEAPDS